MQLDTVDCPAVVVVGSGRPFERYSLSVSGTFFVWCCFGFVFREMTVV